MSENLSFQFFESQMHLYACDLNMVSLQIFSSHAGINTFERRFGNISKERLILMGL